MLEHYIRQLEEIYQGEPWYGESLLDKLDALEPEEVFITPAPNLHSIAQIVAHMLVWRKVLVEHLKGNKKFKPELDSADDWNSATQLKAKGWEKLLAELAKNHQEMIQLLAAQPEEWLERPFKEDHNYRYLLEGIIHHEVYHIGQIGLLIAFQKSR